MAAVRSFARASRGWNVSADGDPMDRDAKTKKQSKGKKGGAGEMRKEGVQKMRTKTELTTSRTDNAPTVRTKETLQRTVRRESTMRKPKLDNIVTPRRATAQVSSNAWQHWKRARRKVKLRAPAQLAATYAQMARQVAAAPAVQCEAILQDEWPDTDSDLEVCVIEVDEQQSSAVSVCSQ